MSAQEDVSYTGSRPALEELRLRPQWVCWRREARGSKSTKVPYDPRTGALARSDDSATWVSYAQAKAARDKHPGRYDGLGYMFCGDYTGIDLDHCVQADGCVDAWAQHWLTHLDSYAEYSPSGTGIHILVRGTIPHGLRRRVPGAPHTEAAIELYCQRRYFTITGRHVQGTPTTIQTRPEVLTALYTELTASRKHPQERETRPRASTRSLALSDQALLEKAMAARNGALFRALWQGDSSRYPSPSEADQALCTLLAFWTDGDAARVDRLFRQSGLYTGSEERRQKWDRPARSGETYGQGTIRQAIASCEIGYAAAHLDRKIIPFPRTRSATTPGLEQLGDLPETELSMVLDCLKREEEGDAHLYAHLFRDKCLYDHTEGSWYEWRGHFWERDERKHSLLLASGPLAAVYLEASATLSEQAAQEARRIDQSVREEETERLKERYSWLKVTTVDLIERARRLRQLARARSVLTYAQALLSITSSEWDTNPWLLGTTEGVLDLRSGVLRPGQPADYLRTVIPTTWRGLHAQAPRFERFLQEIFADRTEKERGELIAFLQRALGYGITGHTSEHIFLMLYGEEGRNGKDTLMSVLHHVLGGAAGAVSNDVIITSGKFSAPGAAKPHLCALQGKRVAWASESDRGARFDVGQVKFLTGGGAIPARQLYGRDYTFVPSHLLLLLTNHKPHADARDAAFWDRLCLLTFNLRFVDHPTQPNERRRDTTLSKDLEAEASGILAWLVRGCLAWQERGLQIPATVRQARQEYREEEDTLGQFLQECCVLAEQASVKAGQLYERYKTWAGENTLKAMTGNAFGLEMKKRFAWERERTGYYYYGIRLLAPQEAVNPCEPTPSSGFTTPPTASRGGGDRFSSDEPVNPQAVGGHASKTASEACAVSEISSSGEPCEPLHRKLFHKEEQNGKTKSFLQRGSQGSPGSTIEGDLHRPVETHEPVSDSRQKGVHKTREEKAAPSASGELADVVNPGGQGVHQGFTHNPLAEREDEGARLLARVRQRMARLTKLFWHVPGSGFENGYLPREEYFNRLSVCLASEDPRRRQAALDELKARVAQ